jgi:hemerythrin
MPTWTPAIAVGHPVIDQQHQELFKRADELLAAMQEGRAAAQIEKLLAFLRDYVREHFGAEERLMAARAYPKLAAHKAQHAEFQRRFEEDADHFGEKGATALIVLDLRDLIRGWLVNHVSSVDKELAGYLAGAK